MIKIIFIIIALISLAVQTKTPPELLRVGVVYAGDESPIAKQTKRIENLDIAKTMDNRFEKIT